MLGGVLGGIGDELCGITVEVLLGHGGGMDQAILQVRGRFVRNRSCFCRPTRCRASSAKAVGACGMVRFTASLDGLGLTQYVYVSGSSLTAGDNLHTRIS